MGRWLRRTRTTSDFGKELDSLADVITFGVAPSLLADMGIPDVAGDTGPYGTGQVAAPWGLRLLPVPDLRRRAGPASTSA